MLCAILCRGKNTHQENTFLSLYINQRINLLFKVTKTHILLNICFCLKMNFREPLTFSQLFLVLGVNNNDLLLPLHMPYKIYCVAGKYLSLLI